MGLVDIKNYLQGLLKLGYGNTSQTPIPTAAFPLDGRTYFESLAQAEAAALLAEQQGSKNTIFYFGMTLVVFEDDVVKEYIIVKDATTGKGTLQEKKFSDIDADDIVIPEAYTLPTATATRLGGIKVGNNLSVDADGTLHAIGSTNADGTVSCSWEGVDTLIIDGGTVDNIEEF